MLSSEAILQALPDALDTFEVPGGLPRGKVRDFYVLQNGKQRVLISTDRLYTFDQMLGLVPYKGQVLNQLSAWWFEHTADIMRNHFVSAPDPNVMIARETRPILLEVVVRGYITGVTSTSLWMRYADGEREIYGIRFPDGLKKNEPLPQAIVTPTSKSTVGRDDRFILDRDAIPRYVDAKAWQRVQDTALALYKRGQEIAEKSGLILVDTKYEFGRDEETGELLLIDELHTPDSSRYWKADSYVEQMRKGTEPENFDKELVRLWYIALRDRSHQQPAALSPDLITATSQRYQRVYEMITGRTFEPAHYPAQERIQAAVAALV